MVRNVNPVAKVAHEQQGEKNIVTLVSGVRVRLIPVPASLIDAVTSQVEEPPVPMWLNPDRGKEEENPNDPAYQRQLSNVTRLRGLAAIDGMAMFGIELVDGMPVDDSWLQKLKFMQARGLLNLSSYDLESPVDLELVYKKFVVATTDLLRKITEMSGITEEEISEAEESFRGR